MSNVKAQMSNLRKLPYSGFSLIELIVVMAIIAILAATALVNFGKNADRDVRLEAEELTSLIRDVQNKALTGEIEGITNTHLCGFGLHKISDTEIIVYYRYISNTYYGEGKNCFSNVLKKYNNENESPEISRFTLSRGVTTTMSEDLYFLVPSGAVFWGEDLLGYGDSLAEAEIILNHPDGNTLTITISSGGIVKY